MNILDLPDTVLMDIMELLSYDEVAKKREVCRRFNEIGQQVLNTGFNKIIQEHNKKFKHIKGLLPRRESERRNHYLARHSDILTSIETRISMLTMTYSKFIDLNICCFIPGRVLDEISGILKLMATTNKPLRPHEVLQELRDISSMAIEHFDEKIASRYKAEHRQKMSNAGVVSEVMVCSSLGDINFIGIKPHIPLKDGHVHRCHNMFCMGRKGTETVEQRVLTSNASRLLTKSVSEIAAEYENGGSARERNAISMRPSHVNPEVANHRISTNPHETCAKYFKRQRQAQRILCLRVRSLESHRNVQDRRLKEATASITELSNQVSELKRQLEDVVGHKRSALALESGGSGEKRPANTLPDARPQKIPKV